MEFFNFHSDEFTISLEVSGFYNLLLLLLGSIGVIFNSIESFINIRNKLFTESLYNSTRLFNNLSGIILSFRHILIGALNFKVFRNDWGFYDIDICTKRGMIDMFTIHLFQVSFIFQCLSFLVSLIHPIYYMMKLNTILIKVTMLLSIIFLSFLPLTMLSMKDLPTLFSNPCTNFSTWTYHFKIYHLVFTIFLIQLLSTIFVMTLWNIYGMKTKDEVKKNLNSFIAWTIAIFLLFWALPDILMIIFVYSDFESNNRAIFVDLFYLLTAISVTIQLPFSLWKNKIIRRHFFEFRIIAYITPRNTLLRISSTF
uniref:G_PROTEIN_RECEP_F1_2 domain-containing protein n=1 Tax=Strongyloides venezuelensis TaxID=75913 RepID=A0A0K0EW88_STRVS